MNHRMLSFLPVLFLALGCASAPTGSTSPARTPVAVDSSELERVRAALQKYEDPIVAVHDGYFSTVGCVEYPAGGGAGHVHYAPGGMGVHFLNTALFAPVVDPMKPQVLVYEPVGSKLRLVAAEWFVPLFTGVKERPVLFGHPFEGPMEGHYPLMPPGLHHYDLHVWLWKHNPAGIFSPTNPDIKCRGASYSFQEAAPKLVVYEHDGHS